MDDGNGIDNIGDKIVFTITVSNTGADQINGLIQTPLPHQGVSLFLWTVSQYLISGTNGSTATTLALGGGI